MRIKLAEGIRLLRAMDIPREKIVIVLNKIDLLPHLTYDVEKVKKEIRVLNPDSDILELSATTGEGMDAWVEWILVKLREKKSTQT